MWLKTVAILATMEAIVQWCSNLKPSTLCTWPRTNQRTFSPSRAIWVATEAELTPSKLRIREGQKLRRIPKILPSLSIMKALDLRKEVPARLKRGRKKQRVALMIRRHRISTVVRQRMMLNNQGTNLLRSLDFHPAMSLTWMQTNWRLDWELTNAQVAPFTNCTILSLWPKLGANRKL